MAVRQARLPVVAGLVLALLAGPALAIPPHGGGGVDPHDFSDHMPAEVRAAIEVELESAGRQLSQRGLLPTPRGQLDPASLQWPLRPRAGLEFEDYYGISNFVDLDPAYPDQLLDYMCGQRTYDLSSGYNHAGVDYFLWPYPWRMMDQGLIEIVAVAPGVILAKHDDNDDRSCGSHTGPNWNAVYVQHADGSVAWYGHMVKNSLTSKQPGDSVAAGEFLGLVGSSGFSTGPHLHLELRSSNLAGADIYEPHAGDCRSGDSLWVEQLPYHDTRLTGIATHDAEPSMNVSCPNPGQEQANLSNFIELGEPVWLSIYFRDEVPGGDVTHLRVYRPDGQLHNQWQKTASAQHFPASWWYWWINPGSHPAMQGEWRFEVSFRDQIMERRFWYGTPPDPVFGDRFEP